jgi:hypothetical protein
MDELCDIEGCPLDNDGLHPIAARHVDELTGVAVEFEIRVCAHHRSLMFLPPLQVTAS